MRHTVATACRIGCAAFRYGARRFLLPDGRTADRRRGVPAFVDNGRNWRTLSNGIKRPCKRTARRDGRERRAVAARFRRWWRESGADGRTADRPDAGRGTRSNGADGRTVARRSGVRWWRRSDVRHGLPDRLADGRRNFRTADRRGRFRHGANGRHGLPAFRRSMVATGGRRDGLPRVAAFDVAG